MFDVRDVEHELGLVGRGEYPLFLVLLPSLKQASAGKPADVDALLQLYAEIGVRQSSEPEVPDVS